MLSIRRWRLILVTLASAVAVVSACSGHKSTPSIPSSPSSGTATDTNVRFNDCAKRCTGTLDGAAYAIRLPKQWNGTLLLWSHGYREAAPWPPDFAPVVTTPQVSPTDPDGSGSDAVSRQLLSQGYALAGSAYKSNGWAVADGVKADEDLHAKFVDVVGSPRRTYVWGGSLGGLITEVVSEQNPKWVDGSAPIYGVLNGILRLAVKDKRLPANPALEVDLPAPGHQRRKYLTAKQVTQLAGAAAEAPPLLAKLGRGG